MMVDVMCPLGDRYPISIKRFSESSFRNSPPSLVITRWVEESAKKITLYYPQDIEVITTLRMRRFQTHCKAIFAFATIYNKITDEFVSMVLQNITSNVDEVCSVKGDVGDVIKLCYSLARKGKIRNISQDVVDKCHASCLLLLSSLTKMSVNELYDNVYQ